MGNISPGSHGTPALGVCERGILTCWHHGARLWEPSQERATPTTNETSMMGAGTPALADGGRQTRTEGTPCAAARQRRENRAGCEPRTDCERW